MENYVNLHNHSIYSALDAVCTPEQLIDKAVEYGHKAIAITEHGNFNSIPRFQKYALEKGIKPILGMEGYIVETLQRFDEKGKRVRDKNNHVILHAMNEIGWKNLMKLNYLSNSDEEHFYYKPRNSFKELFEHNEGIMLGTACLASVFANYLKKGEIDKAEKMFQEFILHFPDRMYAEVQINEVSYEDLDQKKYNEWLIFQATKNGIPIVLSGDTHYVNKDDWNIQAMAFQISRDGVGEETQHVCKSIYYKGIEDYLELNKKLGFNYSEEQIREWCNNAVLIADKCNYLTKPHYGISMPRQAFDEEKELVDLAKQGLAEHFNTSYENCPEEYKDRLKMELNLIIKKGAMRYFLCLRDILKWCDENNIPRGVARGSAGGSLTCTCLGITKWSIDPIKYNLLFERFISEERMNDAIINYSEDEFDGSVVRNNNSSFEELKNITLPKVKEEHKYRLARELYRANIAYNNGINVIDTIKETKNISNAYVIPYILGITKTVDLTKPIDIVSIKPGSGGLDIDSDIAGLGKDLVIKHLQEKYGKERVVYVGTYTEEGIKPAVKDLLRKEGVSFKESNDFCMAFNPELENWEDILNDLKEKNPIQYGFYLNHKVFLDFVPKLQHFIRGKGTHAGGCMIFEKPVYEWTPVNRVKDDIATAYTESGSAPVLDEYGLIKLDILGLNTCDLIDKTVESIEEELVEIEDDDKIIKIVPISYIPKELL